MKLITAKYKISKDIYQIPFKKEEIEQDIGRELEEWVDVKKENFKIHNYEEILFETGFYIASTKEFDELKHLIRMYKTIFTEGDYIKLRNILEIYEK